MLNNIGKREWAEKLSFNKNMNRLKLPKTSQIES